MMKPRPYDDGNMQPLDSGLKNRYVAVLEPDILKTIIDGDTTTNVQYVCKAQTGMSTASPVWQICRITQTATNSQLIEWADGDGLFDNIADDRASLTYK